MATRTPTRPERTSVEATLLARLGLPSKASSQDVEAAHDGLVEYLETAPADLRAWAREQIEAIDEAYALLSDPTIDRSALAEVAPAPVPRATATTTSGTASQPGEIDDEDLDALFEDEPAPRSARRAPAAKARATAGSEPLSGRDAARRNGLARRLGVLGAVTVGVVAIAIAGFNLNGGTGVPPINGTPAPEAAATPAIDTAKVAELMKKIQADPKDTVSLQSLADIYYLAGDYESAGGFLEKIIAVDPKDVTARLALGAAQFNLGRSDGAEEQWRQVLAIEPDNVEAHYDLGFMYLSLTPPDIANVKLEWGKVIAIAPNSDIAKTVATHLASLDASPAPGASGTPASPAPSVPAASPAASPALSPAPSGK